MQDLIVKLKEWDDQCLTECGRVKVVKLIRKVRVKNAQGLHVRPATAIVKLLQPLSSSVSFTHRKETVNAKSIMSILMLAAQKNSWLTITIEGDDAEDTLNKLIEMFDRDFEV